ncbi:hypothetical protein HW555_010085 [Spodoptera exigua]|uniref:Uncharacterized protein n=1 Tax=Spodoptera exigua TaxID=7107 RepID=A0A835L647_SPOEX|nr:hypothetical protein HW555_010085 [Spodoptera exigua]
MAYSSIILISLSFGLVQCYSQYSFESHKYCDDLSPYYGDINLDQISGVWYGVEKIPHTRGEYKIEHTQECFYIDIKELNIEPTPPTPYPQLTNSPYVNRQYNIQERYRIRHFVLEWHEGLWQDDYHIKVNTSHKGFWATDVPNRSVGDMYRFFGGVIQVLKVANNHLVLNFCMRLPNSQLFSVVLSRNENQLTPEDLASIHNLPNLNTSPQTKIYRTSSCAPFNRDYQSITCTNSLIGCAVGLRALFHIHLAPSTNMFTALSACLVLIVTSVHGFCGDQIRWAHHFNIEDVYGMWYGVGYAQHSPDMTNKPNEIGCVTLHISDVTTEPLDDWLDWSILKHNYSDEKWRSYKSNPWSSDAMSGSWLDIRVKRDIYKERRLRVVWDEDGQSVEQVYLYSTDAPGTVDSRPTAASGERDDVERNR